MNIGKINFCNADKALKCINAAILGLSVGLVYHAQNTKKMADALVPTLSEMTNAQIDYIKEIEGMRTYDLVRSQNICIAHGLPTEGLNHSQIERMADSLLLDDVGKKIYNQDATRAEKIETFNTNK